MRSEEEAIDVTGLKGVFSATPQQLKELSGTAIGLSIAWGILQEYEGVLYASPGPHNRGQLEVSMRISGVPKAIEELPQIESKRLKLLLIEDEQVLREALTSFLENQAYEVLNAGT